MPENRKRLTDITITYYPGESFTACFTRQYDDLHSYDLAHTPYGHVRNYFYVDPPTIFNNAGKRITASSHARIQRMLRTRTPSSIFLGPVSPHIHYTIRESR